MRIVEQGRDRLELEIKPVRPMTLCVGLVLVFLVLGFGMGRVLSSFGGFAAAPASGGSHLLGYAAIMTLLVAVFALKVRRLTFDRVTGTVTIATRGVLGRGEARYPLAELRGASVTHSRSGDNGTTYTAVPHFADKTAKVTPYGTSGSGPSRTAQAINDWLGPQVGRSSIRLGGDQTAKALAALETLGIKLPR